MTRAEPLLLGIDLGGTKTAVCIGTPSGRLLAARRFSTHADSPPEQWRAELAGVVRSVMVDMEVGWSDIRAVGLAVPGPMSVKTGVVIGPPNMPAWRNVPVWEWVKDLTGKPVVINNDANAAGLAEYRFGEFKGVSDLVYITLSTGIGAGVIAGGKLVQGADDLGGEVGHMVLDPDGPPCPCGLRGCFEVYCGGRSFTRRVREAAGDSPSPMLLEEAGGDLSRLTVSAVARAAGRGDQFAVSHWNEYLERLAHGLGHVVMAFNPVAIVLGTIAIHLGETLLTPLAERLPRYAWRRSLSNLKIRPSALGTEIGEWAALALAAEALE